MDLYKETSNCVNQRGSVNPANSENSHYDEIQDSGETKNDCQHLQR